MSTETVPDPGVHHFTCAKCGNPLTVTIVEIPDTRDDHDTAEIFAWAERRLMEAIDAHSD